MNIRRSLLLLAVIFSALLFVTFARAGFHGPPEMALVKPIQRVRAQTNTSGAYTWTSATPFAEGQIPVIQITVEDNTANTTWNHKITAISNTAVSISLTKTTNVTVVGISVLGVQATPQAYVHICAIEP